MALPHARGDVEDRAPLDHGREHVGDAWVVRIHARGIDRRLALVRRGRVGPGLPGQQRHVRHHVDAGPHHVEGQRGEHRQVRPDRDPLPVGLGHDRRDQVGGQVGVHLDRTGVGAPGERRGDDEVGLVGDRLHPGHLARRLPLGDLPGTRVVEEAGPGHQGGVVDVGAGDLTDQAGTSEVADLPEVVGHVPDRRHAAVDHLAQPRLRLDAVRRSGEVLVGVDQARDDEPAGEVDDLGALGNGEPCGLDDVDDAGLVDHERHAGGGRRSRPVEDRRVAVDDRRHRHSSLAMRLTLRNTCHERSNTMASRSKPAQEVSMPGSASSAVDKALDLLEAIADSDRPQRLSELAARVGLHRATAHRILVDLVARGWVLRAGDHYLPGPAQLRLSDAAARNSLATLCRPAMEALSAETGLMVNLQVLEGVGHPRRRGRPTRTAVDDRAPARPAPDPRPLRRTRGDGGDARRRGPRALPASARATPTPCATSSTAPPPTASPWSADATNRSSPR